MIVDPWGSVIAECPPVSTTEKSTNGIDHVRDMVHEEQLEDEVEGGSSDATFALAECVPFIVLCTILIPSG